MGNRVAIVGIGQTHHRTRRPDVNEVELVNEAARRALEDAQLKIKEVDAVLCGNMDHFEGHYLFDCMAAVGSGAYLKPGLKMGTGGTTGGTMLAAACHYVASGLYDTVMTIGWEKHDVGPATTGIVTFKDPLCDRPFGAGAVGSFATVARRYIAETGCRPEHAAMVRVKAANNALRNPYAHLKLKLTIDDVLKSRMISYPLRLLDMCPQSCGACALIVASEEKAKKITSKPVWVKDHVTVHEECFRSQNLIPDPVPIIPSQTIAARQLFKRNGITRPRKQLDVFEMYEPSTWSEMMWMEDFLICDKGEAWKLVEKGVTTLEGEFPINPSGGVVCTNPIGATAMIRPAEAALQVRGDAGEHQVHRPVKNAIASSFGGCNWTIMFLLSKEI